MLPSINSSQFNFNLNFNNWMQHIMISSPYLYAIPNLFNKLKLINYPIQIILINNIIMISIYDIRMISNSLEIIKEFIDDKYFNIGFYNNQFYRELINQGITSSLNYDGYDKVLLEFYNSLFILHTVDPIFLSSLKKNLISFGDMHNFLNFNEKDGIHILILAYFDVRICNQVKSWLLTIKDIISVDYYDYLPNINQDELIINLKNRKNKKLNQLSTIQHNIITPSTSTTHEINSIINNNVINSNNNDTTIAKWNIQDTLNIIQNKDLRKTFMIKNIPNKYTQSMLLELLNQTHQGKFDFIYLRMDFKNKCNGGYAFINFIDTSSIIKFINYYVGKKWPHFNSEKVCDLAYANIQGIEALLKKFQHSRVLEQDPSYQPLFFLNKESSLSKELILPTPPITTSTSTMME